MESGALQWSVINGQESDKNLIPRTEYFYIGNLAFSFLGLSTVVVVLNNSYQKNLIADH